MARQRTKVVNRHWSGFTLISFFGVSAGTSAQVIVEVQHDRETLIRTRGSMVGWVDGAEAPAVAAQISVGLILVPEGTQSTVLWSPLTDSDAPWFYYSTFLLGYEEYVVDVIQNPVISGFREVVDSKAMRRVRNQEIQMVVENTTLAGALTANVWMGGRFLTQE